MMIKVTATKDNDGVPGKTVIRSDVPAPDHLDAFSALFEARGLKTRDSIVRWSVADDGKTPYRAFAAEVDAPEMGGWSPREWKAHIDILEASVIGSVVEYLDDHPGAILVEMRWPPILSYESEPRRRLRLLCRLAALDTMEIDADLPGKVREIRGVAA